MFESNNVQTETAISVDRIELVLERFWYPEMWKLWAGEQIVCYPVEAGYLLSTSSHGIVSWA